MRLEKISNEYYLFEEGNNMPLASTHKGWIEIHGKKLSIKNCQSIELGYDLDELSEEYAKGKSSSDVFKAAHKRDFIAGAKAILEIIDDKKFSEEDIKKAMLFSFDVFSETFSRNHIEERIDDYLKSLKQTEWDVQIEMTGHKPKLDADGCLVLKLK